VTREQRRKRRLWHVVVDLLEIVGGGMVADGISRHSMGAISASAVVIGIGLWLDRRNAIEEDGE
jgi:hypothetical protein